VKNETNMPAFYGEAKEGGQDENIFEPKEEV
jgi:hypothetical protein